MFMTSRWCQMIVAGLLIFGCKTARQGSTSSVASSVESPPDISPLGEPLSSAFDPEHCGQANNVDARLCVGRQSFWPAVQITRQGRSTTHLIEDEERQGDRYMATISYQGEPALIAFRMADWQQMIPASAQGVGLEIPSFQPANIASANEARAMDITPLSEEDQTSRGFRKEHCGTSPDRTAELCLGMILTFPALQLSSPNGSGKKIYVIREEELEGDDLMIFQVSDLDANDDVTRYVAKFKVTRPDVLRPVSAEFLGRSFENFRTIP